MEQRMSDSQPVRATPLFVHILKFLGLKYRRPDSIISEEDVEKALWWVIRGVHEATGLSVEHISEAIDRLSKGKLLEAPLPPASCGPGDLVYFRALNPDLCHVAEKLH